MLFFDNTKGCGMPFFRKFISRFFFIFRAGTGVADAFSQRGALFPSFLFVRPHIAIYTPKTGNVLRAKFS
jgi:hypothetical protein